MTRSRGNADARISQSVAKTETIVRVTVGLVGIGCITYINPSFGRTALHVTDNFPIRGTPGDPNRILGHSGANLPPAYQCLVAGRKALVRFEMMSNSRLGSEQLVSKASAVKVKVDSG